MRRWLKKYGLAALFAACVVVLALSTGAQAASRSKDRAGKYYPPLMQNWQIFGPYKVVTTPNSVNAKYAISLRYPGMIGSVYRAIGNKDVIPAMRVWLPAVSGAALTQEGAYKSRFAIFYYWSTYHKPVPKTDTRWQMINGVPTWTVLKVSQEIFPRVFVWISGQPGKCFSAKAGGYYYKKVKKGTRIVKVLAPIPHAPVQTAQACLPGAPPPVTTAG